MWGLSLTSFSWHWIPFGQLFHVLTKVIGCTWERKIEFYTLSEIYTVVWKFATKLNFLYFSLVSASGVSLKYSKIFQKFCSDRFFTHCVGHFLTIRTLRLPPWPQEKKGTISALLNMYWASPIPRAVSLIFFFCQVDTACETHARAASGEATWSAKIWNYFFDFNVVVCNRAGCDIN